MAGRALKLVNKLARRMNSVKMAARGRDQYDKTFLNEETLQASPRALELLRKAERRIDRAFGTDFASQKPALSVETSATLTGNADGTITCVFPTGVEGYFDAGIIVGDLVQVIQQGTELEQQYFTVTTITDSVTVVLSGDTTTTFTGAVTVRIQLRQVIKSYY